MKGFIITFYGVMILHEHEAEKNIFASCLLHHITNDSSLAVIAQNSNKYIKFIDLNSVNRNSLKDYFKEKIFECDEILKINRAIQKSYNLSKQDKRDIKKINSIGDNIREKNSFIGKYDSTQFNMVHSPITSHQRIRGLAGSGKTILMLKKMAFLHYRYPEYNIAFIFYTISLKSSLIRLFEAFYRDYNRYSEPDMSKVNIMHAWGGYTRGFYSDLCEKNNFKRKTYNEALHESNKKDPFEFVCHELNDYLMNCEFEGVYDYIFVDEAQDFGIEFFRLCLNSLKKNNNSLADEKTGFLIYAYDELQSLKEEVTIPSKKDIFSEEICTDINLKISYRTTVEVLTTAHAIGLGIYRNVDDGEHPLVNYVDETNFLDMGYKNEFGEFAEGKLVRLFRTENKSKIIIPEPLEFLNEKEQYECLADKIIDVIKNEDVLPSDIMIIDLDETYLQSNHEIFSDIFYKKIKDENTEGSSDKFNIRIRLMNKNTPNRTIVKNEIIFTTIYRAKGNEANLVIIINCNSMPLSQRNSLIRNKIFTAMTRSRWMVWLYGQNMDDFKHEIKKVREMDYKLEYTSPTASELKQIRLLSAQEKEYDNTATTIDKLLNNLPDDIIKKLFERHIGKEKNE